MLFRVCDLIVLGPFLSDFWPAYRGGVGFGPVMFSKKKKSATSVGQMLRGRAWPAPGGRVRA